MIWTARGQVKKMNFNQLKYFVAIVEQGSFWAAALEEYISQSSLSKQIKALENELGVVLFNRSGNKITLTEAGQCFYEYALKLLEIKNRMQQDLMDFKETPIEEVKFASIPIVSSYKISLLLSEFQKVNKNRKQVVNYNILEEEQKDVLMLLKNDKVDFAFVRDGFNMLPDYEHRLFLTDEIGLICSQESELAQLEKFDFSMLRDEKIILISPIYRLLMEELHKVNKECNVTATMTRHRNVFSMVANNVGITFFTKRMFEEGHTIKGLKYVPLVMPIYSNVYIVKRKEKALNATTERFWEFLCSKYQEYLL